MNICVLCEEDLDTLPTNLEHYVHAVLIRNFDKLCVPKRFDWALRRDERQESGALTLEHEVLAPISAHKSWATVRVHSQCNSDLSYVGSDFKYIIENIDNNIPDYKFRGIFEYFSHLWKVEDTELVVRILTENEAKSKYNNKNVDIVYMPFLLSCGRIEVECPSARAALFSAPEADKVLYTITLGAKEALERL